MPLLSLMDYLPFPRCHALPRTVLLFPLLLFPFSTLLCYCSPVLYSSVAGYELYPGASIYS